MQTKELNVEVRENLGKGPSRRLRGQNKVPGVFYGPHMEKPVMLAILDKDLSRLVNLGPNTLLTLKAAGHKAVDGKMAVIRQEQFHPVTDDFYFFIHIWFFNITNDFRLLILP